MYLPFLPSPVTLPGYQWPSLHFAITALPTWTGACVIPLEPVQKSLSIFSGTQLCKYTRNIAWIPRYRIVLWKGLRPREIQGLKNTSIWTQDFTLTTCQWMLLPTELHVHVQYTQNPLTEETTTYKATYDLYSQDQLSFYSLWWWTTCKTSDRIVSAHLVHSVVSQFVSQGLSSQLLAGFPFWHGSSPYPWLTFPLWISWEEWLWREMGWV